MLNIVYIAGSGQMHQTNKQTIPFYSVRSYGNSMCKHTGALCVYYFFLVVLWKANIEICYWQMICPL